MKRTSAGHLVQSPQIGLTSKVGQVAWGIIQSSFENFWGWKFPSLSGQAIPLLNYCQFFALTFSWIFPCCSCDYFLTSFYCPPLRSLFLCPSYSRSLGSWSLWSDLLSAAFSPGFFNFSFYIVLLHFIPNSESEWNLLVVL